MHLAKQKLLNIVGAEPTTLDELAACVVTVLKQTKQTGSRKFHNVIGFAWNVTYNPSINNSHNAPLGKSTNWNRDKNDPMGYPGFSGRVWVRYADEVRWGGSDAFDRTLTYTGTGGAGAYGGPWANLEREYLKTLQKSPKFRIAPDKTPIVKPLLYSWDYRFFIEDWPLIHDRFEKEKVWTALQGINWKNPTHHAMWEDPNFKENNNYVTDELQLLQY